MPRKRKQEDDMQKRQNSTAALRLRSFVERIERVQAEMDELRDDIKAIRAEAKAEGYDVKTIARILKLRKMSAEDRQEQEALLDLYKAALGMLDGTPLGRAARDRFRRGGDDPDADKGAGGGDAGDSGADADADNADSGAEDAEDAPDAAEGDAAGGFPPEEIEKARAAGAEAARAGVRILQNPFVADDPRRAAWDEGWCQETGSDGMDLPEAWRPKPKKKPADEEGGGA